MRAVHFTSGDGLVDERDHALSQRSFGRCRRGGWRRVTSRYDPGPGTTLLLGLALLALSARWHTKCAGHLSYSFSTYNREANTI